MAKFSTNLRNQMLVDGSFTQVMNGTVMRLYQTSAIPASADDAIGAATLLCTITINSGSEGTPANTLQFAGTATDGVVSKDADDIWSGVVLATGVANLFRMEAVDDTGAADPDHEWPRIQGTVGLLGADLNLSSTALVAAAVQRINAFHVALPTL